MRHPWSIAILLAASALAGHAARARPVQAQVEALLFAVGETVTFSLHPDGTLKCRDVEIRGTFTRCTDPSTPVRFGDRSPGLHWINVAVVKSVSRLPANNANAAVAGLLLAGVGVRHLRVLEGGLIRDIKRHCMLHRWNDPRSSATQSTTRGRSASR